MTSPSQTMLDHVMREAQEQRARADQLQEKLDVLFAANLQQPERLQRIIKELVAIAVSVANEDVSFYDEYEKVCGFCYMTVSGDEDIQHEDCIVTKARCALEALRRM